MERLLEVPREICEFGNRIRDAVSPRRGIRPKFQEYHVVKILELLECEEPIGRPTLTRRLGLGESSVRSLLRRLRELGLVGVDEVGGAYLTEMGRRFIGRWHEVLRSVDEVKMPSIEWPVVVRGVVSRSWNIVKRLGILNVRDIAVRRGAMGLIIVLFNGEKFLMPVTGNTFEEVVGDILKVCEEAKGKVRAGDVILLVGVSDPMSAEKILVETVLDIITSYCSSFLSFEP